jgi:hypothetical protein
VAAGARLIIATVVFCQFVDIHVGQLDNIPLSGQKILAVVLLPVGVALVGALGVPKQLFYLGVAFCAAFSASWHWRGLHLDGMTGSAPVILGVFAACCLYTALNAIPDGYARFARYWVLCSVASSAVMPFQMLGYLPLPSAWEQNGPTTRALGTAWRASGWKSDPNIQSLMLCIGLGLALVYCNRRQLIYVTVIFTGILCTFSRMGLLIAACIMGASVSVMRRALPYPRRRDGAARARRIILGAALLLVGFSLLQARSAVYFRERISEALRIGGGLLTGGTVRETGKLLSSTETRSILLWSGMKAAVEAWPLGVGAGNTEQAISRESGLAGVSHNTYVEIALIGGAPGLVALGTYLFVLFGSTRDYGNAADIRRATLATRVVVCVFLGAGLFLSITYNSLLWIPPALVLSLRGRGGLMPNARSL